jgi:hypothetical protein
MGTYFTIIENLSPGNDRGFKRNHREKGKECLYFFLTTAIPPGVKREKTWHESVSWLG